VSYLSPGPTGTRVLSADQLQKVDVVLLGETGLCQLTEADVSLLHGFVCGGGRVVVAANRFFRGTIPKSSAVVAPFGLKMEDVEPPAGIGVFELTGEAVHEHALTAGVGTIVARRPSPTIITDRERGRPLVRFTDEDELMFVALATTESGGEVVTLGVSLWWSWISQHEDNARLLRNLLTRTRKAR